MSGPAREHNVEAVFTTEERARAAADALQQEFPGEVTRDATVDRRAALRAEMRDEVEAAVVGPGNVGPFTKSMTRGIALWVPVATVIGAAVGVGLAMLPWAAGLSTVARVVTGLVIGAVAGATAGFVIGGGFRPRREEEGEELAGERGWIVGLHTDDLQVAERAERRLREAGAERVDRADARGYPVAIRSRDRDETRPVRGEVPTAPPDEEERR
jgi:hypothetical protein